MRIDVDGKDGESKITCISFYNNIETNATFRENYVNKTKSKGLCCYFSAKGKSAHLFVGGVSTQGNNTQRQHCVRRLEGLAKNKIGFNNKINN